jgi:hypothetical protein
LRDIAVDIGATVVAQMADRKMHQTTVRFGADLWEALEIECAQLGVSVAQFVRESALARLMYMAGRRGESAYDAAFERATLEDAGPWAQGQVARRRGRELREEPGRRRCGH